MVTSYNIEMQLFLNQNTYECLSREYHENVWKQCSTITANITYDSSNNENNANDNVDQFH